MNYTVKDVIDTVKKLYTDMYAYSNTISYLEKKFNFSKSDCEKVIHAYQCYPYPILVDIIEKAIRNENDVFEQGEKPIAFQVLIKINNKEMFFPAPTLEKAQEMCDYVERLMKAFDIKHEGIIYKKLILHS